MKILYTDYNDITKHVVLKDVMEHAVNKCIKKKPIPPQLNEEEVKCFEYLPQSAPYIQYVIYQDMLCGKYPAAH